MTRKDKAARNERWLHRVYFTLLGIAILGWLTAFGVIMPYAGPLNGGTVLHTPFGCVGFEFYGHPGPFYAKECDA